MNNRSLNRTMKSSQAVNPDRVRHMTKFMKYKFLGAMLLVNTALPTHADAVVSGFTGGSGPFGAFYGDSTEDGDVVGFSFTADVNLTVTDLGILNEPGDGILDSAHMVGLWDATTQALLA